MKIMNDYKKYVSEIEPDTAQSLAKNLELDKILYVIAIDQKGKVVVGWPGADTVDVYIQERMVGQNAEYKVENDLSKAFGLKRFFTEDGRCLVGFTLPSGINVLFSSKNP